MLDSHVILHLSLIKDVGPVTIQHIKQYKPASLAWHDLYRLSVSDWMAQYDLSSGMAEKVVFGLKDEGLLAQELALFDRADFNLVTIIDPSYPDILSHINAPPPVLYVQGADLATFGKCIAMIGARTADRYGKQVIESLVPPLVEHGWSIVSGGALGADAMAHAATLKAGGKTIAVLGAGLLHPGPTSNLDLFDNILAHDGALVSMFSLSVKNRADNFPNRNRVISGMSRGVIVVQAARKSGTRITAQYALEQGRDVFAIPGLIDHPLSEGCHALIQEGAKLISRVEDVLEEYGEISNVSAPDAVTFEKKELQQDLFIVEPQLQPPVSGGITAVIRAACKNPISMDDLMAHTKVSLPELQTLLFNMQLDGLIQQNFAGLWEAS